ncbi:hypothetical protein EXU57_01805 [Segetibacter sp. 3557_3]|uniref:outer membrane beta-barrel protein n=1 Tax=Segetibacter sp. 3557_3 TaxID=2547429 RepID=UPI001058D9A8|nr:outer membrane beta-barrel protein [Segetibacter sp. 3557_3]TDH28830.1 hypothetical protein EXU57_01805 [Segetibacter sp. 3557_3]
MYIPTPRTLLGQSHPIRIATASKVQSPKKLIASIAFLIVSLATIAQQQNIVINVVDSSRQAIPFATVQATEVRDSSVRLQRVTDSYGFVTVSLTKGKTYILRATSVSYAAAQTQLSVSTDDTLRMVLLPVKSTMGGVVVTTTRPMFRQEDDKMIVDPENLALSSTNAFEILEKTPGLFVDQDGNVYLSSTTPARIYINGREQKMSAADISTMLKSLPPNAIASIEILRTPSAKYDASGGGGIVNVVLKKGVRIGLTGSINLGLNQGTYGNQFAGVNLNNSNGKSNSYVNLQFTRRNTYDQINTDRLFASDSLLSQQAYSRYPGSSFYLGYGGGYQLNNKWELSYDGRINTNESRNNTLNTSDIRRLSSGSLISSNLADVQNRATGISATQSFSSKYKPDSAGSEWTNDVSYTFSPNNNHQDFSTSFKQAGRPVVGGDGVAKTKLGFLSFASNLLLKLPRKVIVETGLKTTFTRFENNADYYREINTIRTPDEGRTAYFKYRENINSGYLQASKNIGGIIVKAGGRVENTNMNGNQYVPKDTSFNIHRTDFFPYVSSAVT